VSLRLVVADDSVIIRTGLLGLVTAGGMSVAAEAEDADDLVGAVAVHRPDVALVDIRMPPSHTDEGVRAAQRIRREYPATAVLVLSQFVETAYAMELLAGDSTHIGYLLKDRVMDRATLLAAIWRVAAGEVVVDAQLVTSLMTAPTVPAALDRLTAREREVLALMAEGLTDRAIGERLNVSLRTVHSHVQHLFDRLDIPDTPLDNRRVRAVLEFLRAR